MAEVQFEKDFETLVKLAKNIIYETVLEKLADNTTAVADLEAIADQVDYTVQSTKETNQDLFNVKYQNMKTLADLDLADFNFPRLAELKQYQDLVQKNTLKINFLEELISDCLCSVCNIKSNEDIDSIFIGLGESVSTKINHIKIILEFIRGACNKPSPPNTQGGFYEDDDEEEDDDFAGGKAREADPLFSALSNFFMVPDSHGGKNIATILEEINETLKKSLLVAAPTAAAAKKTKKK
jgi:hypothetical protein